MIVLQASEINNSDETSQEVEKKWYNIDRFGNWEYAAKNLIDMINKDELDDQTYLYRFIEKD